MSEDSARLSTQETTEPKSDDLKALGAEIINLFYTQAFSPEEFKTEEDVCRAFAGLLRRHWKLCCIVTYVRSDKGRMQACAVHRDEAMSERDASAAAARLAAAAEKETGEVLIWPDVTGVTGDERETGEASEMRAALARAGMHASVAVPVHAHNILVGVLIVMTTDANRLCEALKGIRLIAAPIVIAVGNARRASAYTEQRRRIEYLVKDLQGRSAALEEANCELKHIARYRSLFLARMSHELRTPLTSILGFAEILLEHEEMTPAQRRFCEKIQASGWQLQTSLDRLVDLSRLEAGHAELFLHEFSLRELLRESSAAVARLAQKQGVKVESHLAADSPPVVSDGGKMRQAIYNFLAFAISRSPANARVTISVEQRDARFFEIEISDEGEPLADPAYLFEPMGDEAAAPNERETDMNELGLIIAARLVKSLGGTIEIDEATRGKINSERKSGLGVRLRFPFRLTEATV